MRLALGLSVHTGWAAALVVGGSLETPHVAAREHVELLAEEERFVFHRAAEAGSPEEAERLVARARREALERAVPVLRRLAGSTGTTACAIVAKAGTMRPLSEILAAHPRIHTAEGLFYRDALREAAEVAGLEVQIVAPSKLDPKDPRLAQVGRVVGKPWSRDWKLAALAAWKMLGGAAG